MRFKKGSKVEVFSDKEVPYGAWRCAVITSGNGRTYSIKYDCPPGMMSEAIMERVSRKTIRPCPPPVDGVGSWAAGEMVEVFDDFSWKIAIVLKNMGRNNYFVRLLGSLREFQVHKMNIRVRQSWRDNKWFIIKKGSGSEFAKSREASTLNYYQKRQADAKLEVRPGDNCLAIQIVSAGTLKRASPLCSSSAKACTGNPRKLRAIEKDGASQRVMSGYPSSLLKKVDAVACPRENLGDTYMHASFNNPMNGFHDMERGKSNYFFECLRAGSSETNDSDNDACSVGSCSVISYNQNEMSSPVLAGHSPDADALSSDAESFNGCRDEGKCTPPLGVDVAARIHRLELHAYRSTLEALYASGPLSWEQEALLTNLRLSLNISNDEHLTELRNIISAGNSLCIS